MKKLLAIGEALIDMIPSNTGRIKDVQSFSPKVGGAPLNVCGAYSKLGGNSNIITMLGNDPFGDKILDELNSFGINVDYVKRTNLANTSLAFVALDENANREFSFYRKIGADMLLSEKEIEQSWFSDSYGLHFCSVSLGDFPMRQAHDRALKIAKEQGIVVSFDPNVRLPLFDDHEYLRKTINEYLKYADILKISEEEVEFIFGNDDIEKNLEYLFDQGVKLLIYTSGKDGATAFTKHIKVHSDGIKVNAIDTTGAGDGFIGSFLYQLSKDEVNVKHLENLKEEQIKQYLDLSNKFCAFSVTKEGTIASYPTFEELTKFVR